MQAVVVVGLPLGERPEVPKLRVVLGQATDSRDAQGRHYAVMSERLSLGMSGAPVLSSQGRCRGLFQGILAPPSDSPLDPGLQALEDRWDVCAGFIPAHEIEPFLDRVRAARK